jgi:D-sedoheptulose 7-phosphate isomerase
LYNASGNSPNVLRAIEFANEQGAITIGFLGFDGGKAKELVKESVIVQNYNYGQVEDVHMFLAHSISHCFREWIKIGYEAVWGHKLAVASSR